MTSMSKLHATFTLALVSASALSSIADAAGRGGQPPRFDQRPQTATFKPAPVMNKPSMIVVPRVQKIEPRIVQASRSIPELKLVPKIEKPRVLVAKPILSPRRDEIVKTTRVVPSTQLRPFVAVPVKPEPRVTMPTLTSQPAQHDRAQHWATKPAVIAVGTLATVGITTKIAPYLTARPWPGQPLGPGKIDVPTKGGGFEPGPKADGGNNNNNAGPGQRTGGDVGRGGTAVDSSDNNVSVGKDGTFVIGGASANGGNNNGNATGQDSRSGNNAGRGGKVVDDRDYNIDPSKGSTIVVKADTANGGNNNGNATDGGRGGRGNGNGGKVIDDRDIHIEGGDQGNTIIIEKDQAKAGSDNGRGNGKAGEVIDKRDIRIDVDKGDKIVYDGKTIQADAGDTVIIRNGHVYVKDGPSH